MKKILIMCEGPNELKVVNLLLDHGKLKFSRDDLLDMRPFHARQLASPQLKPALDAYHGELEIYRIGDKDNVLFDIRFRLLLGKTEGHAHAVALHFHHGLAVLINQFQLAFILHDSPPSSPH